jgi:hypothetical protein
VPAVHLDGARTLVLRPWRKSPQWTGVQLAAADYRAVFSAERCHAFADSLTEAVDCLTHAGRLAKPRTLHGIAGNYAGAFRLRRAPTEPAADSG